MRTDYNNSTVQYAVLGWDNPDSPIVYHFPDGTMTIVEKGVARECTQEEELRYVNDDRRARGCRLMLNLRGDFIDDTGKVVMPHAEFIASRTKA